MQLGSFGSEKQPPPGCQSLDLLTYARYRQADMAACKSRPSRASRVGWYDVRLAENANSCVSFQERERLLRSKRHRGKGLKLPKVSLRGGGEPSVEGGPRGRHAHISAYLIVETAFYPLAQPHN